MYQKSLLVVAIFSVLVSVAAALMAVSRPPEGLYATPIAAQLGDLGQGERKTTEFRIKNGFSKPITIGAIRKSCGCTQAELQKTWLRPGEETTLKATLATGRARGMIHADLTLFFNTENGEREWTTLRLTANVVPDIECEPRVLVFRGEHGETKEIRLSPKRLQDFRIKRVYSDHAAFAARLVPACNIIQVRFESARWNADVEEARLMIETSSTNEPTIVLPLRMEKGA